MNYGIFINWFMTAPTREIALIFAVFGLFFFGSLLGVFLEQRFSFFKW